EHPLEAALRDLGREKLISERVAVRRLPVEGTAALAAATVGIAQVSDELAQHLHRRTDGNAFFTREVVRALIERGDLYQVDGRWQCKDIGEIEVPESIRSVIGQRAAHLPPEAQEALHEASVLGQTFSFADVAGMTGRDDTALETALERATVAGLVRETGVERYAFSHVLLQQALYAELPTRHKRRLHLAAGEALDRLPERERTRRAAELAWHFLQADDAARALPYTLLAGDRAEEVYAHAEAERHYSTALELARERENHPREAEALE